MKCRVKLVKAEEITLQEMAINHRFKNTRRRATGLLMLARGDKPKVVCEALGVSDQAVYNWAHAWRIGGVCALTGGHNGGRPRALFPMMWSLSRWRLRGQSRLPWPR